MLNIFVNYFVYIFVLIINRITQYTNNRGSTQQTCNCFADVMSTQHKNVGNVHMCGNDEQFAVLSTSCTHYYTFKSYRKRNWTLHDPKKQLNINCNPSKKQEIRKKKTKAQILYLFWQFANFDYLISIIIMPEIRSRSFEIIHSMVICN